MNFLLKVLVSSFAVLISAYLLPGVSVDGYITAIIVALVIAILNSLLRPVLIVLTIPITFFTFGLFLLVINAFIIIIASKFVDGFSVNGFWWALFFSIILSITTSILEIPNRNKNKNSTN
jgi:putative membrane protein